MPCQDYCQLYYKRREVSNAVRNYKQSFVLKMKDLNPSWLLLVIGNYENYFKTVATQNVLTLN